MVTNKTKVENLLKNNLDGLTIQNISDSLKLSRQTIAIILAELKGEKKITIRKIGMSKLHLWRKE